jgi:hypothetical protein
MNGYAEVTTSRPRQEDAATIAAAQVPPLLDDTARMMGEALDRLDSLRAHLEKYSDATLGTRPSGVTPAPMQPKSPPPRAHLLRDMVQSLHERIAGVEDVASYLVRTL